jgi:hypothetical protein
MQGRGALRGADSLGTGIVRVIVTIEASGRTRVAATKYDLWGLIGLMRSDVLLP